jgi:rhodanese-related sulfurtransferase
MFPSKTRNDDGVYDITPEDLKAALDRGEASDRLRVVDVRRPEEYHGELGHIEAAHLSTLGPELLGDLRQWEKDKCYVFVCRSGQRSISASLAAQQMGFTEVYNLAEGMLGWRNRNF